VKWLRRIYSLEFLGICIALVTAYFAWIPIKAYFSNENPIEVQFGGKGITLSDDVDKSDAIRVWAFTHEKMKIQIGSLVLFNNRSNHVVKGLNVEISFSLLNIFTIISPEWEYLRRGDECEVRNIKSELRPSEKLFFPFNELSLDGGYLDMNGGIINPDEHAFFASAQVNYDGCESPQVFNMIMILNNMNHDSYYKIYGDTAEYNRRGFNNDFLSCCLKIVSDSYNRHPGEFDKFYILINLYDNPLLLNKDDVIRMCKERGID